MLREHLKNEIIQVIEKSTGFNANDFNITAQKRGNTGVELELRYRYEQNFFLKVVIPNEKTTVREGSTNTNYFIQGSMCPGEMSYIENVSFWGKDALLTQIKSWLTYLKSDLISAPINRILVQQKQEIERLEKAIKNFPDEYFSIDEAEEYKEKLDSLEELFVEHLKNQVEDENKLKEQIEKINNDIDMLKQTILSLKKQGWVSAFIVKITTWMSNPDNKKLVKAGSTIIKGLLPDGIKDAIPDEKIS